MLPILYQNNDFILYSYPLLMGLGWGIAYQVFFALIPENYSSKKAQFLFWSLFVVSWIGAKLLFYFTLPKEMDQNLLSQITFWTGGGFVFYGGLILCLAYLLALKAIGLELNSKVLWPILPALTFGHAVGRIGCLLAGCCFGKVTDLWWGIFLHDHYRHPTQLLEAVALFLLGLYLLKSKKAKLLLVAHYFILYGFLRLVVESLRGDEIRGLWGILTPSQWVSLILIMMGLTLLHTNKINKLIKDQG